MARLYLDENAGALVRLLREAGHDVSFAKDVGQGRSDPWHFRQAISERRVMISLDTGFYYLHGLWTTLLDLGITDSRHSGILTVVQSNTFDLTLWSDAIRNKLQEDGDLTGKMLTWHAGAEHWGEDVRPPWKGLI
jgi:Domain of unknown function (DUF5615)